MALSSTTTKSHPFSKLSLFPSVLLVALPMILHTACCSSLDSEATALFEWKASLGNPQALSSWELSISPCTWAGIKCNNDNASVTELSLPRSYLTGKLDALDFAAFPALAAIHLRHNFLYGDIPTSIGTLSYLNSLDIAYNRLTGVLPHSLGNLSRISKLDLAHNSLTGPLPREIGNLVNLVSLLLHKNKFSGSLPSSLGNLTKLRRIYLYENTVSGPIPPKFSNLVNLVDLDFTENNLSGCVPSFLGNFTRLQTFSLQKNNIFGSIPHEIGNAKALVLLMIGENSLSGSIPASFGNLTKLNLLYLQVNNLSGPIPPSFGNLAKLSDLRLFMNNLSGPLPNSMRKLTNLTDFILANNSFKGQIPSEICRGGALISLLIENNKFDGPVPKSLKNCTSLQRINLRNNQFKGNISEDFAVYPNLTKLDISFNQFYGQLSPMWGYSQNLSVLQMSGNMITGHIPLAFGELHQLGRLDLHLNKIAGPIPSSLFRLTNLFELDLSDNEISGTIPIEIGQLKKLQHLELSGNKLAGSIPRSIGDCYSLISLDLSRNQFRGSIPVEIGKLESLNILLDISYNRITGELPEQLSELKMLSCLNLSHNNLSGEIPSSFGNMQALDVIILSFNNLEGPLPDGKLFRNSPIQWFTNNKGICGDLQGLPHCLTSTKRTRSLIRKFAVLFVLPLSVFLACVLFVAACYLLYKKRSKRNVRNEVKSIVNLSSELAYDGKAIYDYILYATENFDEKYCIGNGGYGSVYLVELPTGKPLAVKKIHLPEDQAAQKSFINEIQVLTEIRHRNIVKLYGFCEHTCNMFLIYDYIARGSLASILANLDRSRELSWERRFSAIRDVASALSYIHNDCSPPIVHRDLSTKNILIDPGFKAYISDFGIAKILNPDSLNWSSVAGTFGYLAPELSYALNVTEKADVYSFGVVTLEILMGRHPMEIISNISSLEDQGDIFLKDLLDDRISLPQPEMQGKVVLLAKAALSCIRPDPRARLSMKSICGILANHHNEVLFKCFTTIKLHQLMNL